MSGRHCPFLNRNDPRCGTHFQVKRLADAFDRCFGQYVACPTYRKLLAERLSSERFAAVSVLVRGREVALRPRVAASRAVAARAA